MTKIIFWILSKHLWWKFLFKIANHKVSRFINSEKWEKEISTAQVILFAIATTYVRIATWPDWNLYKSGHHLMFAMTMTSNSSWLRSLYCDHDEYLSHSRRMGSWINCGSLTTKGIIQILRTNPFVWDP